MLHPVSHDFLGHSRPDAGYFRQFLLVSRIDIDEAVPFRISRHAVEAVRDVDVATIDSFVGEVDGVRIGIGDDTAGSRHDVTAADGLGEGIEPRLLDGAAHIDVDRLGLGRLDGRHIMCRGQEAFGQAGLPEGYRRGKEHKKKEKRLLHLRTSL